MRIRNLVLAMNQGGKLESGYYTPSPDNSWRIDTAYRLANSFDMVPVHPRPMAETHTMAYYKWANTSMDYTVRLSWFGGEGPYRVTLLQSPTAAYIGDSGKVQTWSRSPVIGTVPLMYRHDKPNKMNLITCPFTAGDIGQTFTFRAVVESQSNDPIFFDWTVTVDNTKFRWFDVVNGADGNAGTFASPYANFPYGYNLANAQNYINVYKPGTYAIHNGTPGNAAAMDTTHCRDHICYGSGVKWNFDNGFISAGTPYLSFIGMETEGGLPTMQSGNIRQFNLSARSTGLHMRGMTFNTNVTGNSFADNPCAVMTWDQSPAGSYHDYISIVDCTQANTSKYAMAILFSTRNSVDENNYCNGMHAEALTNTAMVFHYKDGNFNNSSRFNNYTAATGNGILHVSNQSVADCGNMDINFSIWVNQRTGSSGYVNRWNGQVTAGSRPPGQWVQRCSIDALSAAPFTFETFSGGDNVNYSGISWETAAANIAGATTGGTSVGAASIKVTDIFNQPSNTYGVCGADIISTLVT